MSRSLALALLAAGVFEGVQAGTSFQQEVVRKSVTQSNKVLFGSHRLGAKSLVSTTSDQGFWFSNFTVGGSPSLSILLDTGSSDAVMNPGVYQPGANSQDTGQTFNVAYATSNPDGSGSVSASGEIYQDVMGIDGANLSVAQQAIGSITQPASPPTFPHDGLVGLAGQDGAQLQATPWFTNLCNQKTVAACRFGLALGTDGTGVVTYGSVDTGAFDGQLATVQTSGQWQISGGIAVNGQVTQDRASIITDSGTTVIFGPISDVQAMFQAAGMATQTNQGSGNNPTTLDGFYDCSNPPQLGFQLGGSIFNVLPAVLAQTNNGGNCTAVIHGSDEFNGQWLVGQAFFQGRYIDHNVDAGTMGFANLK